MRWFSSVSCILCRFEIGRNLSAISFFAIAFPQCKGILALQSNIKSGSFSHCYHKLTIPETDASVLVGMMYIVFFPFLTENPDENDPNKRVKMVRKFECQYCGKLCFSRSKLKSHLSKSHTCKYKHARSFCCR